MSLPPWQQRQMYSFAKFLAGHLFLQNRDKNIKKFATR
jgi:hypothetical protein